MVITGNLSSFKHSTLRMMMMMMKHTWVHSNHNLSEANSSNFFSEIFLIFFLFSSD